MVPTLRHGDALLVRRVRRGSDRGGRGDRVRAGDLVVGRFPAGPPHLVVKRAVRPVEGGWWLEGDNPLVADDSRAYGPGVVLGRVLLRYWPPRTGRSHPRA